MNTRWFMLSTCSDIVVTRESGTVGAQETLDYIPGSALLGALIAGHGGPFDPDLFLSGKIRCSDALPCVGKQIAWPMPLCYFINKKGEDETCAKSALALEGKAIGEQLRDGYMTADGQRVSVNTTFRMKSGMDRTKFGAITEGQLFGYEAISAGQNFIFSLSCMDAALVPSLAKVFSGTLRIGRSKSAEYGLVEVGPLGGEPRFMGAHAGNGRFVLYCASDICLMKDGMVTTVPAPGAFGLPEDWYLDLATTFIRTRSYSPWNAFHNRLLSQRSVICRGSILSFRTKGTLEHAPESVQDVGCFVEEGLGRVLVNPEFVTKDIKVLSVREKVQTARDCKVAGNPIGNLLVAFMDRTLKERNAALEAMKIGRDWAVDLSKLQARIGRAGHAVPGKSQWSFVRQIAIRSSGVHKDLIEALEELTQDTRRKWWTAAVRQDGKDLSLHSCLIGKIIQAKSDTVRRLALMHAAVAVGRGIIRKQEDGQ